MTYKKDIIFEYHSEGLKTGFIKLNQLEKVYGRMFTSNEVIKICDLIEEWFPYSESNPQKKCDNFLSNKISVRENLNYVLFNKSEGNHIYNTFGEVV